MAENITFSSDVEKAEFAFTRVFDAPRNLVFKAWTESDSLAKWWGAKGTSIHVNKFELKPGGIFHYAMQMQNGQTIWGKFVYREIRSPERLVFVSGIADEAGNTVPNPWNSELPKEILNTVDFAEQDKKTVITLRGTPINATASERKTFAESFKSIQYGFKGTLDQLDEYLSRTHR